MYQRDDEYDDYLQAMGGYATNEHFERLALESMEPIVKKTIDVMEDWFQAIEAGIANDRMPNRTDKRYDSSKCDRIIRKIDTYFQGQVDNHPVYFHPKGIKTKGVPMTENAGFERLEGGAREAFVQDLLAIKEG